MNIRCGHNFGSKTALVWEGARRRHRILRRSEQNADLDFFWSGDDLEEASDFGWEGPQIESPTLDSGLGLIHTLIHFFQIE